MIIWGDSMRAYGFGIALILLTGALLWRFVEKPDGRRFAAAAIAAIASVHTLYYNSVLLLAFCAGAVAVCSLNRAWKTAALVVLIGCLAAISIMPYAATIRSASSWNVLVQMQDYDLFWFRVKLDETLRPAGRWALKVWVGLFAIAVLAGVRALRAPSELGISQRQREAAVFSLVALVVGVLAVFVFSETAVLPHAALVLSHVTRASEACVSMRCLEQRFRLRAYGSRGLSWSFFSRAQHFRRRCEAARHRMSNVDLVTSRLHEIARPGDLVLVHQWYNGVTFNRYYHGPARWMTVPPIGYYRFHRYDIVKQQMMLSDQAYPVAR